MLIAVVAFLSVSCANTRRVLTQDERILYRNKFDIRMDNDSVATDEVRSTLEDVDKYVRQRPRNGFFNFYRSIFNAYYWVSLSDSSWWARTMRNIGTAPVIYSPSDAVTSARQIERLLARHGSFHSTVTVDTVHLSQQRVVATYHINASPRFVVDNVNYISADSVVQKAVGRLRDHSPLQAGNYYDQDDLDRERDRFVNYMLDNGYFRASTDLIHFQLDTFAYPLHQLGVNVVIDSPRFDLPGRPNFTAPYQQYFINKVTIDTTKVNMQTINRMLTLRAGQPYMPRSTTNSYNALAGLRNFNLINIEYREDSASSNERRLLDARVRLVSGNQQRISGSFELSNASPLSRESSNSGNFGTELVLQYQHKNLFGGAEQLSVSGNLLVELNKSVLREGFNGFRSSFASFETGVNLSLDMPRFLFPYGNGIMFGNAMPHTLVNAGFDYQYRSYFERHQVTSAFGYTWNASQNVRHKIMPLEVSFVQVNMNDDFIERLLNVLSYRLLYQYSDHLIINANYNFVYNGQRVGRRRDFSYFSGSLETAGNLAALIATTPSWREVNEYGGYNLVGVAYSQYVRGSAEYKRYFYHGDNSVFVARTLVGIGIPYGNSSSMPYEKSFFGGGPTNMRAWQIRHLGPGHFNTHDNADGYEFDEIGDITFVLNLEERFPIIGIFEGAVFADIGNVWMFKDYEYMPGAAFSWRNFFSDLALGVGLGLRVKVSFITLRLDFAIPVYDPTYASTDRWRISQWKFNSINTNFGINYPF